MIVKCVRCDAEFESDRKQTHVCPSCHFVFGPDDTDSGRLAVVTSSELAHQKREAHSLHEGTAARCAYHTDVDAIACCVSCGKPICYVCSVETAAGCHCERCADGDSVASHGAIRAQSPAAAHPVRPQNGPPTIGRSSDQVPEYSFVAWEQRRHLGRQRALFRTWLQAFFRPMRFFQDAYKGKGLFGPALYGTIWILIGLAGGIFWRLILPVYPEIHMLLAGETVQVSLRLTPGVGMVAAVLILLPIVAALLALAACVIFHLSVSALSGGHGGFRATMRTVCYSMGVYAFYFVPALGGLIAGVLQMILVTVGFMYAHRLSFPRAVAAAFVPCAVMVAAGTVFASWAVAGTNLDAMEPMIRSAAQLFSDLIG